MEDNIKNTGLLPHLFRVEYTKMTAVICRLFGIKDIEIAEDIVSETFLKATETWGLKGLPHNPVAWLYTVAKNKTRDYIKHHALFMQQVAPAVKAGAALHYETVIDFTPRNIQDSQLEMIFAVCGSVNPAPAQICLALQILCGFSVEEIADAFLENKETIKKRLFRARENLRSTRFKLPDLQAAQIASRLDKVLTVLYLLFNEGYFSKSGNSLIRKDLCFEAIRLAAILSAYPPANTPKTNALLALMCFQASRLDARVNSAEEVVLFDEQDRNLWDKALIEKGNGYLVKACSVQEWSKYHFEAAIAYWHTSLTDGDKWRHILQLYNHLVIIEYSPITALNRTFAFAKVYGHEKAIEELEKLDLQENAYYHSLMGFLYAPVNKERAISCYNNAVRLLKSPSEKKLIHKAMEKLKEQTAG